MAQKLTDDECTPLLLDAKHSIVKTYNRPSIHSDEESPPCKTILPVVDLSTENSRNIVGVISVLLLGTVTHGFQMKCFSIPNSSLLDFPVILT